MSIRPSRGSHQLRLTTQADCLGELTELGANLVLAFDLAADALAPLGVDGGDDGRGLVAGLALVIAAGAVEGRIPRGGDVGQLLCQRAIAVRVALVGEIGAGRIPLGPGLIALAPGGDELGGGAVGLHLDVPGVSGCVEDAEDGPSLPW